VQLFQKLQVNAVPAVLPHVALAPALAQFPRLVAAEVEAFRFEQRQILRPQFVQKLQTRGVWFQRCAVRHAALDGMPKAGRALREMLVFRMFQPALEMAEGIEIGGKLDAEPVTVTLQVADLRRG
jgi:hypothetical protein